MFPDIDWTRPWYDAVRPAFDSLIAGPFIAAFNANAARLGLVNDSGQPLRFVPQDALPEGMAYEAFIGATGCVPTRANLHDFFNGLVWQTFPRIKRALNALQAAQIAQAGVGKSRGPARDAATIFDENAALLVVPRKAITAHVRVVPAAADFFALDRAGRRDWIDAAVSKAIAAEGLSTAGFTPLPVLGVQGWWPDQDEADYLDPTVFRPRRPASNA
jgi:hypothetical protein